MTEIIQAGIKIIDKNSPMYQEFSNNFLSLAYE